MSILKKTVRWALALPLATAVLSALPAHAQSQKAPRPGSASGWLSPNDQNGANGPGQFGGGPGQLGGGPGGPGRPGGPPPMTVTHVPLPLLASELKLTADQKTKIGKLQATARPPRPGDGQPPPPRQFPGAPALRPGIGGPGPGGPPREEGKAEQQIEKLLTAGQRSALPSVLKQAESLRAAGIPLELYGQLNPTTAQKSQILAQPAIARTGNRQKDEAARKARHEKVLTMLNSTQRSTIEAFRKAHPRPGPPEGRGPGGPGGPPPPGGGFGGPDGNQGDGPPL